MCSCDRLQFTNAVTIGADGTTFKDIGREGLQPRVIGNYFFKCTGCTCRAQHRYRTSGASAGDFRAKKQVIAAVMANKIDELVGRLTAQTALGVRPMGLEHQFAHLAECCDGWLLRGSPRQLDEQLDTLVFF